MTKKTRKRKKRKLEVEKSIQKAIQSFEKILKEPEKTVDRFLKSKKLSKKKKAS